MGQSLLQLHKTDKNAVGRYCAAGTLFFKIHVVKYKDILVFKGYTLEQCQNDQFLKIILKRKYERKIWLQLTYRHRYSSE